MHFPEISPIAITFFDFDIYWYSLAYVFGFLLGLWYFHGLNRINKLLNHQQIEDLFFYAVIGLIAGARLGFCVFYEFNEILRDPLFIFNLRGGGMSFHGGLIGMVGSIYLVSRKYEVSFLGIADQIVCVAPIGLFLGRLANFINAEIYGKVTDVPWGIIFPHAGIFPRHPTQLYEAVGEGLVLLVLLHVIYRRFYANPGVTSGAFLIGYSLIRYGVEFFKEPLDGYIAFMTIGQALTLPMFVFGAFLIFMNKSKH